ncbi:filamentation induced by cAMP protein Fic [Oxalobacteraceae bacterium IMCC9480]|nr:filamentation induced by cAMP protein Fic [Oxalobacteraceae bacterium IMCC9480]
MATTKPLTDFERMLVLLREAGPAGLTPNGLALSMNDLSRSTVNRRLSDLVRDGVVKRLGAGRSTRYLSTSPFTLADIERYLERDPLERAPVPFDEALLSGLPNIDADKARRLEQLTGLAVATDQKFLSNFLIDMSWGSSLLEGGTYSDLDTQALLQYGQRNPAKPVEDAVLVLNHKSAIEYLWTHRDITVGNLCEMQSRLTDHHDLPQLREIEHFLPPARRGVTREYEDVNLHRSAYLPPFRPGTGYITQALELIVRTALPLRPVESAFYLMTRIPYLQAFANGNKRTARLAANMPLLSGSLLPISFVDFDRSLYLRGMAAFYELGSILLIEQAFIRGYLKSIIRGSRIPVAMRVSGFDASAVAARLLEFVNTGSIPSDVLARAFIDPGRAATNRLKH